MTNLEELKKQYESGDWVCYGQVLHGVWEKQSTFKYGNAYKLIHKSDEHKLATKEELMSLHYKDK